MGTGTRRGSCGGAGSSLLTHLSSPPSVRCPLPHVMTVCLQTKPAALLLIPHSPVSEVAPQICLVFGLHGSWVKMESTFPFMSTTVRCCGAETRAWLLNDRLPLGPVGHKRCFLVCQIQVNWQAFLLKLVWRMQPWPGRAYASVPQPAARAVGRCHKGTSRQFFILLIA